MGKPKWTFWPTQYIVACILKKILFFFLLYRTACGIFMPWPGIEPTPPAFRIVES